MNKTLPALQDDLLSPLSDGLPCGENLEYDPEYLMLQTKATERPETQYGDFVSTPENVNWNEVERECLRLLLRTKDIRLLVLLLRSRIQLNGARGLYTGTHLLCELIKNYPVDIHPQTIGDEDTSAEEAAIIRANALAALADPEGVLSDIRNIVLSSNAALRLQVRDVERALSIPRPADALSPDSVRRQLLDLRMQNHTELLAFSETVTLLTTLQQWINESLQDAAPDLTPLKNLLECMLIHEGAPTEKCEIASLENSSAATESADVSSETTLPPIFGSPLPSYNPTIFSDSNINQAVTVAPISNRFDALQRMNDIRAWFELNEPSSPSIPLLRQAERMVGKRFSEVVDAIPLELLQKWDEING